MEEKKREDRDVIQFAGFGLLCATGSAVPPQCIHTNIHIYIYIYILYICMISLFLLLVHFTVHLVVSLILHKKSLLVSWGRDNTENEINAAINPAHLPKNNKKETHQENQVRTRAVSDPASSPWAGVNPHPELFLRRPLRSPYCSSNFRMATREDMSSLIDALISSIPRSMCVQVNVRRAGYW